MSIKVYPKDDIYVTEEELERYRYEYSKAFTHYCGPIPSLESFIRSRKNNEYKKIIRL